MRKLGYLKADTEDFVPTGYDPASDQDHELARTMAASVQQRIAFGERAGQKVRRIGSGFGYAGENPTLTGTRCASVNGFSLHANTHVPAHRRDQLERLLRYTARGAVSLERLEVHADGDLLYTFTRPWSDGTTGIKPRALMCALFWAFSCLACLPSCLNKPGHPFGSIPPLRSQPAASWSLCAS